MKSLATIWAVNGWAKGMKYEYFVSLSTTTSITLWLADLGRPSTKSMEMCVQAWCGIGKGTRRPR
jgi:hypothetical protein